MRRGDDYSEELSKKLRSVKFARAYFSALTEAPSEMSVEDALRHAITRMGIKEFSQSAGVPTSNIHEFLKKKRKLKTETLDIYLKPFGLRTRIILENAS